jgi:hypothetical protein
LLLTTSKFLINSDFATTANREAVDEKVERNAQLLDNGIEEKKEVDDTTERSLSVAITENSLQACT